MEFTTLDLPEQVLEGIREAGFVTTTPIQEAALPLALKGKDVAGQSQTGTGKTAAFLIAAFTRLLRTPAPPPSARRAPRVLVIAPTRELVVQIESDAHQLGRFTPFNIQAVYGGIDYAKQRDALAAGCDVLIGTPGRLIDYLKQHVWTPRRVEVLVIDEADRMFDMGFIADLRFILRRLPPPEKRQSFLFSATLSFRVLELTWEFMNNPSADHDHAAAEDGRARGAAALPRRPRGEVRPAAGAAAPRGRRPHPDLLEHARGGPPPRGPSHPQRLGGARAHRRRRPEAPAAHPQRLQGGAAAGAGGDRRRLARAAHRGGHATSSTGTCRRTPRTTCTASAARRGPAPGARPSASWTRRARSTSRRSRSSSARRSPSSGRRTT